MGFYTRMQVLKDQQQQEAEQRAMERQQQMNQPQLIAGPYAPVTPQVFAAQQQERDMQQRGQIQSQLSAQDAQQGLQRQFAGADLQNQMAQIHAQQQNQFQQQRDYQQHQYGMESQTHGADLQSRLSEVQLGQQEAMRLQRLKQAKESVNSNPDLSPEEKRMLGTQIESGMNPLENRQREAQMIHQTLQSHALQQQTMQQATLFNQRQEALARGIAGNVQTLTDPETGVTQQFFVDQDGRPTPLDFAQSRQLHELRMTQGQVGIAGQLQGIQQSADQFPQRMELLGHNVRHAGLTNEQLGEEISQGRQMNPLRLESMAGEIDYRRQQLQSERQRMQQSGEAFPLEQEQRLRHLDQMSQAINHSRAMNPLTEEGTGLRNQQMRQEIQQNPQLFAQNLQLLQQRVSQGPEAFDSHQAYQTAQTEMIQSHTEVYREQARRAGEEAGVPIAQQRIIQDRIRGEVRQELEHHVRPTHGNPPAQRPPWLNNMTFDSTTPATRFSPQMIQDAVQAETMRRAATEIQSLAPQRRTGALPTGATDQEQPAQPFTVPPVNSEVHSGMMTALGELQRRAAILPADRRESAEEDIRSARLILQSHAGRAMSPADFTRYQVIMNRLRSLPTPAPREQGPSPNPLSYVPSSG